MGADRATQQPTSFTLTTYTLSKVFNTPELITSLAAYSKLRQAIPAPERDLHQHQVSSDPDSLLFLQVFAAADYFTTNKTLMHDVPPVNVEISKSDLTVSQTCGELMVLTVLDPFLLNVLPKSLLPTGIYLIVLAVLSWYLSDYIFQGLYQISQIPEGQHATLDASKAGQRNKKVN